jgi:peptidoglycan/LPS O-acetylase OafA/YrhL
VLLGEISYSIYLVHWILLQLSNRILSSTTLNTPEKAIWAVGFIASTLLVAACTFQFIEQPARRWGRRLSLLGSQAKAKAI